MKYHFGKAILPFSMDICQCRI